MEPSLLQSCDGCQACCFPGSVNDVRPICLLVMKPNYPGWDPKSMAMVFCDFYLTAKIMAPSSHRQMRMWTELVTNERDLEQKVPCLEWWQRSPGVGAGPHIESKLLQMCKQGLAPLTVMALGPIYQQIVTILPIYLSKYAGLSFSNQNEKWPLAHNCAFCLSPSSNKHDTSSDITRHLWPKLSDVKVRFISAHLTIMGLPCHLTSGLDNQERRVKAAST